MARNTVFAAGALHHDLPCSRLAVQPFSVHCGRAIGLGHCIYAMDRMASPRLAQSQCRGYRCRESGRLRRNRSVVDSCRRSAASLFRNSNQRRKCVATQSRKHRLIEIDWPDFGLAVRPPVQPASVFSKRIDALRFAMETRGLTHVVVYADREHFANLAYLTDIDPRFEEILLIIARSGNPLIVTGNECRGYLGISPLFNAGLL